MSLDCHSHDFGLQIGEELKVATHDDSSIHNITIENTVTALGFGLFTQDESKLRGHAEMLACDSALCRAYVDIVLASRNIDIDPERDRVITTAASNAISVLNYASRSGLLAFSFLNVRDWSGIRIPYANLNYALMAHCNLDNADLSNSSIVNTTFLNAQLRNTNLSGTISHEPRVFHTQIRSDHPDVGPYNLVVHPNGMLAASGTLDKGLRVFNFETDEDICCLSDSTSEIYSLGFSRDGSLLGSVYGDKTVRIWDTTTFQCRSTLSLSGLSDSLDGSRIAFSPDNRRFALVQDCDSIGVGDIETSEWTMTFQHEEVLDVDWSPNSNCVASYSWNGTISIWDAESGSQQKSWQIEGVCGCNVMFTRDGQTLVVNTSHGVRMFDAVTGISIAELPKVATPCMALAVSSQYICFPSGAWICVFDLQTHELVVRFQDRPAAYKLFWTADDQKLVSYSQQGCMVRSFDMASFRPCTSPITAQSPILITIAFSSDNCHVVTSSTHGELQLWNVKTAHCAKTIVSSRNRGGEVYTFDCSPNGRLVAFAVYSTPGVEIHDIHNGKLITVLDGCPTEVIRITFDPSGDVLATSAQNDTESSETNGNILLWDTKTWKYRILRGHTSEVPTMCFSPDGNILVSLSEDRTIRMWDVTTNSCIRTICDDLTDYYACISYSYCGRFLASLDNGRLRVWDVNAGQCITTYTDGYGGLVDIKFLPDGHLLGSYNYSTYGILDRSTGRRTDLGLRYALGSCSSCDGTLVTTKASNRPDSALCVWRLREQSWASTVVFEASAKATTTNLMQMLVTSSLEDGFAIAFASDENGSIHIPARIPDTTPIVLQGHSDLVTCLHSSTDAPYLASGSRDGSLRLWSLETKQCIAAFHGDHASAISCIQISSDNRVIASGSDDATIRLWDVSECKCVSELEGHTTPVQRVVFSSDNESMASLGKSSNVIHLWNLRDGSSSCSMVLSEHTEDVFDVQFSYDGAYLASASNDDTIKVWDVKTGECTATLKGHTDCLTCFVWSKDTLTIVSGSEDKTLRIWNALTGECSLVIKGHTGHIRSLCLTPDNQCIISTSTDRVIHIWDRTTGEVLHQLFGHADSVTAAKVIHYNPQGESRIISISSDRTIRVWTVHGMSSRPEYSPELRGVIGAQDALDLFGADLTGAIMDGPLLELAQRIGAISEPRCQKSNL